MPASTLLRISQLAPTLKEAELRVLLALAADVESSGEHSTRASVRGIAKACAIAPSAVQRAISDLAHRGLITKRAGTTTQPSGYLLNFLRTTPIATAAAREGVPLRGTPLYLKEAQPSQEKLYLEEAQGVPATGTPSDENTAVPRRAPAVDIDGVLTLESIIDRLHRASPRTVDPDTLDQARRFLHVAGPLPPGSTPGGWIPMFP